MFTTEHYEQQRQAVIDLFSRYIKNRSDLWHSIQQTDGLSDDSIKLLNEEIDKLKKNQYLLAIVGESKAGKSMFINALLKKPILPTGILQCTSGIIEISDTDNSSDNKKVYLKVAYGNNPKELKTEYENMFNNDTTPIQEKLREIASIQEEYRALPIFQLNQYLVEKKPERITNQEIEYLLSLKDDLGKDIFENPHKLPINKFTNLIKQYLLEYKDLSKIPVGVTVGYPLGFKFSQMRIVDTPGTNARGGLKDATIQYVIHANAAIFLHMAKNIASSSLNEFFKSCIPEFAKDNVFMFLSHKALFTKDAIEITLNEAKQLFPEIKEERLIAIDSMLKQIYEEIKAGKPLKELRKNEEMRKLIAVYLDEYEEDKTKIPQAILKDSNFSAVETLLRKFSEQALAGQLRWVVKQITNGYREQTNIYKEAIQLRKSALVKKPEEFDQEINSLKELLEQYRRIINDFCTNKQKEYTGLNSEVHKEFSELLSKYKKKLADENKVEEIRTELINFNSECEGIVNFRINKLSKEYVDKMKEVGVYFQTTHNISPPKIDVEDIKIKAQKRAYETITIQGDRKSRAVGGAIAGGLLGALSGLVVGGPIGALVGVIVGSAGIGAGEYLEGSPTKTEQRLNNKKYQEEFLLEAKAMVTEITDMMRQSISDTFFSYNNNFRAKLGGIIKERQNAYESLREEKEKAEELCKKIQELETNEINVGKDTKTIEDIIRNI